jgi:hypothetical protein
VYVVQPLSERWNVVIAEVRHEQQIFSTSATKGLDAHTKDASDVELIVNIFKCRHKDNVTK